MDNNHCIKRANSMNSASGFILMTSLIFLLIFSFLGVYAFNTSLMEIKMSDNFNFHFKALITAENILRVAEKQLLLGRNDCWDDCVADQFEMRGRYYVDDLGNDCCSKIIGSGSIAHYYRVVAKVVDEKNRVVASLQSTYAFPEIGTVTLPACEYNSREISIGRQSWSY
jgi:Tfp pilus assembly protein PilX